MRITNMILLPSFIIMSAWSALADNENSNNWFIEGQLQKSLYEGTDWITSEFDTPGSDSTLHVHDTAKSKSRDKLDSAGVAFGYLFNEQKTALSIAYENFGSSTWESGQYTATDGRVFDNSEYPMNMHTYMLELTHIYPVTESRFLIALAGIGQANIKTSGYAKTLNGARGAGNLHDRRVENFSKRLGAGMGFKLSSTVQLIGVLQYSDYGQSETVGHFAGNNGSRDYDMGIFTTDVNAIEASIRLRYHF